MKLWKLTLFALVICLFAACDDEDEPMVCLQDDWIGTYTGTVTCNGNTEDATVTITASGTDQVIIRYQTATVTTTFDPVPFNGCMLERTVTSSGVTGSLSAERSGNMLTLRETLMGGGFDTDCSLTATKN